MNGKWNNVSLPNSSFVGDTMLLLTDGSVLSHNTSGKDWYRLSPDSQGNYAGGTWSSAINMKNTREYFASGVLKDGRVFVIGGEVSDAGNDTPLGEIFDPVTGTWSPISSKTSDFDFIKGDCSSCILEDGRVLLGSIDTSNRTAIWDPAVDIWLEAGLAFGTAPKTTKNGNANEETWTLLPDGNVLTVETFSPNNTEKYIPSQDTWVQDGATNQQLPITMITDNTTAPPTSVRVFEIGPALLLPDGRVFAIGATGHTEVYTPPPPGNPAQQGAWLQGPDFPADAGNTLSTILTVSDGPACLLPNGKVLCVAGSLYRYVSPKDGSLDFFSKNTQFFLYTPAAGAAGTIAALSASGTAPTAGDTWTCRFLLLPSGDVLFTANANQLTLFTPDPGDGAPSAAWQPAITNCPTALSLGHTYMISGSQLNGLSQANSYGDDAQMATNFPLVQLQNPATGEKKFLRTFNFSSMGVAAGSSVTGSFNAYVPYDTKPGPWNLVVITNGIASAAVAVNVAAQDCFFILDRSTFGNGEITALLQSGMPGTPATIDPALYVVVEGFTPADCGINSPADLAAPGHIPVIPDPAPGKISLAFSGPVLPENPALPGSPQRFTYPFRIVFADTSPFSAAPETLTLTSVFTSASNITVTSQANIYLVNNPNPFILHGDVQHDQFWYLSMDMRVFQVKAGDPSRFGTQIPNAGAGARTLAPAFIQQAIANLNKTADPQNAAWRNDFEAIPQEELNELLTLAETDTDGVPLYNFALARVRLRDIQGAQNVRVFFRMWGAQQTSSTYDPNTTYRTAINDGGQKVPLLGVQDDEIVNIPFFATERVLTTAASMSKQTDDFNAQDIPNPAGGEAEVYYGCWLDINQPNDKVLPPWLAGAGQGTLPDGPYAPANLQSIQQLVRSQHQCLVAEIAYDPDPIPTNADPSTSDKLAQRNLTFVGAPNPGEIASRRVPQTFELRATPPALPTHLKPDELMITWGNTPAGSMAAIYLPSVSADELLTLADQLYPVHRLSKADANTLECPAEGITFIPIPKGQTINFAGLLTIDLPPGIIKGQVFQVVVRQITTALGSRGTMVQIPLKQGVVIPGVNTPAATGNTPALLKGKVKKTQGTLQVQAGNNQELINWRRVLGGFKLTIPVSTKKELIHPEERLLSVLRWIERTIPIQSRWHPVFGRYLEQIAGRVRWMGGDPGLIGAHANGIWQKPGKHDDSKEKHPEIILSGKVAEVIYDCFGDFKGFVLQACSEKHFLKSCEKGIEPVVRNACNDRSRLHVHLRGDEIEKLVIGEPPC